MPGTPEPISISTKQDRIAKLARQIQGAALRTLAHNIDLEWLKAAHVATRKDAAAGVDGMTAKDYERDLEANLERLLDAAAILQALVDRPLPSPVFHHGPRSRRAPTA